MNKEIWKDTNRVSKESRGISSLTLEDVFYNNLEIASDVAEANTKRNNDGLTLDDEK